MSSSFESESTGAQKETKKDIELGCTHGVTDENSISTRLEDQKSDAIEMKKRRFGS
jgi:hypothetical protein